jgi:hypothetical protein
MKSIMTIVALTSIVSAIFGLLVSEYFFALTFAAMALAFAVAVAIAFDAPAVESR